MTELEKLLEETTEIRASLTQMAEQSITEKNRPDFRLLTSVLDDKEERARELTRIIQKNGVESKTEVQKILAEAHFAGKEIAIDETIREKAAMFRNDTLNPHVLGGERGKKGFIITFKK